MTREIALHCMKSASELERELCEECPIYGQTGCDHCYEDALQYVIEMLEQEPCKDVPDTNVGDISCTDAIRRQAAIDAFERFIHELGIKDEPYNYGEMALSPQNVPPVTPAEKVGQWINNHNGTFECDRCGCKHSKSKWCPNCGAKMQEVNNG